MARKPPKSKKSTSTTDPHEEREYIDALRRSFENNSVPDPKRPSFIPEDYVAVSLAAKSFDGGWETLSEGLYKGTIQGFLLAETGKLIEVPAEDWRGSENDNVAETDVVTIYSRAISGMRRNKEGFAIILNSSLIATESFGNAIDTSRSGFPGRPPKLKQLIEIEFSRRIKKGQVCDTLTEQARELRDWAIEKYPSAQPPTEKTIKNNIRLRYRSARNKAQN